MQRRPSAFLLRLATAKRLFVGALKTGLVLTPAEQKAIALMLGLLVLGCLCKAFG